MPALPAPALLLWGALGGDGAVLGQHELYLFGQSPQEHVQDEGAFVLPLGAQLTAGSSLPAFLRASAHG